MLYADHEAAEVLRRQRLKAYAPRAHDRHAGWLVGLLGLLGLARAV